MVRIICAGLVTPTSLEPAFQMDVRIWSPARAGLALDRHNLARHRLVCRANPPPRAIRTDLRCRTQLARMAAQLPKHPLPADSPLWRTQLDAWVKTEPGRDYESFSAGLYALDLFIPLDALGQEKNWAPSASRGAWGEWGHRLRWLVQMAGWVITAMGAAVVTGLIGRRD